jgi:hypothetical protein
MMGHSLSSFRVEPIYNYAASRLNFLKEPQEMEVINGVARKRIEKLEKKSWLSRRQ